MELQEAFAKVLSCEQLKNEAESFRRQEALKLDGRVLMAERNLKEAWIVVDAIMKADGLVEDTLPGDVMDYRIHYTTPRESVDVPDVEALPDEFIKLEKTARKKEIGEFLKACHASNNPLPNWAVLKLGESKLTWKAVKKTAREITQQFEGATNGQAPA